MDLVNKIITGMDENKLFCVAEAVIPNNYPFPVLFENPRGHFIKMIVEKENSKTIKILRFRNEPAPRKETKPEKGGLDEIQFSS